MADVLLLWVPEVSQFLSYQILSSQRLNYGSMTNSPTLHFTTLNSNELAQRVTVPLQVTASQSVCLGVEPRLGLMTKYLLIYFLKVTVL
jgi:hypothetical protein